MGEFIFLRHAFLHFVMEDISLQKCVDSTDWMLHSCVGFFPFISCGNVSSESRCLRVHASGLSVAVTIKGEQMCRA